MSSAAFDTDVLIVGLGPVGAAMAALLTQNGVSVIAIERDVKTYSSALGGAQLDDQQEGTELMMLNQDPPQHTRLRNLVARGFTPKVIKAMEPHIREAAQQIVEFLLQIAWVANLQAMADGTVDLAQAEWVLDAPIVALGQLACFRGGARQAAQKGLHPWEIIAKHFGQLPEPRTHLRPQGQHAAGAEICPRLLVVA